MNIVINQTLHGYSDGHSLLSSSIELGVDSKRIMLGMSDMSGQSMHPMFESYLTAYPLKESGLFAFARTWYAPEMERPGCVYTHTLLIDFVDLIKINSLRILNKLFIRPQSEKLSTQLTPIQFTESTLDKEPVKNLYAKEEVSKIISLLYGQSDLSVLIAHDDSITYEDLCLAIWEQQWPRLKRSFMFCTGSISSRTLGGKIMDLQVIPNNSDNNTLNSGILVRKDVPYLVDSEWIKKVVDDLYNPGALRDFFVEYGSDTTADRKTLKNLTEVFITLEKNKNEISEIITKVGTLFGDKTSAVSLKNQLLSCSEPNRFFPSFNQVDVLKEFAITEVYSAFDFDKSLLKDKLQKLYDENPKIILQLLTTLLEENINPLGVFILQEISTVVTAETDGIYDESNRNLLLLYTKLNPILSYNPKFWQVNTEYQRENFYTIYNNSEPSSQLDWKQVVDAIFIAGATIPKDLYKSDQITFLTLDWFNNYQEHKGQDEWLVPKYFKQSILLDWLSQQSEVKNLRILELLIYCLNPNSKEVLKLGVEIWISICSEKMRFYKDRQAHIRLNSFGLAVAFNSRDKEAKKLIELTFEQVYMAAQSSRLDYDSWQMLECHTKPLGFWIDWDKCKKLAIALLNKYQSCKWNLNDISKVFSEKFVFDSFIRNVK